MSRRGNSNQVVVGEVSQANPTTAHTLATPLTPPGYRFIAIGDEETLDVLTQPLAKNGSLYFRASLMDQVRAMIDAGTVKDSYPQDSTPLTAGQEAV